MDWGQEGSPFLLPSASAFPTTVIPFEVYLYGFIGSMGYIFMNLFEKFDRSYRSMCEHILRAPLGPLLAVGFFLVTDFLLITDRRFYTGRPDILVLKYDTTGNDEQLTDVLIGEVKHTTAPETFATGLRELSEYLYFARTNTEYLFDTSASSVSVTGLICTDGVTTAADSSHDITHLTADDF